MNLSFKKIRVLLYITFIFIASISFSGCAWIPFWGEDEDEVELESELAEFEESELSPADDLRAELKTLQSQQEDSQLKLEELEESVISMSPRVKEVEEFKEEVAGNLEAQMEKESAEMEILKDTVNKLESQIQDLKDTINEMEFEAKLRSTPKPRRTLRGASRSSVKNNYDKALRLFNIKQYKESLSVFKSLDNRRTQASLRDNVIFWIGQCYSKLEDYEKAIEKFNVVADEYGSGNKAVDSLFAIGVAYNALGEKSKALDYLDQALNKRPSPQLKRKINMKIKEIEG